MQYVKRFFAIVFITIFLLAAGFVVWAEMAAQPQQAALQALRSDEAVTVTETGGYITFTPAASQPTTGFVFYPGGRVAHKAYAPLLRQVAAQGYLVALVPVRLNLAFFDLQAAQPVLQDFPQVQTWVVGGHSLGGVAAALFAEDNPQVQGLILMASTPPNDHLRQSSLPVLSLSASLDGLFPPEDVEKSLQLLPTHTVVVEIQGGNHAQFGDYGAQAGDNPSQINPFSQWQQASLAVASFLRQITP